MDKKQIMLDYLQLKIKDEDWHGAADCCMDLRDMQTEDRFTSKFCAHGYPLVPENNCEMRLSPEPRLTPDIPLMENP